MAYPRPEVTAARIALDACDTLKLVADGKQTFALPESDAAYRALAGSLLADDDGQRHLRAVLAAYDDEIAAGYL